MRSLVEYLNDMRLGLSTFIAVLQKKDIRLCRIDEETGIAHILTPEQITCEFDEYEKSITKPEVTH